MNHTDSCTATFNNIVLKYEDRGFSKAASSKKAAEAYAARTLEEFDRYYVSRPGYTGYTPPVARPKAARPASQRRPDASRAKPVESRRVEAKPVRKTETKLPSQVKNEPSKVRRAVEKLTDASVGATRRNFKRLPAATLVTIVACMMSLVLLVGSTVMTGDITNEYSELKSQVNALANEESKLATELNIKNDLRVIEDIAINKLGMVSKDLIVRNYVKLDEEDMIESFTEPESNVGLSTLLSAIAGK